MRTVEVNVTQEDIDKMQADKGCVCAVQLAMSRATGKRVVINMKTWGFDHPPWKVLDLPQPARDYIQYAICDECYGPPFTFTIEVPE